MERSRTIARIRASASFATFCIREIVSFAFDSFEPSIAAVTTAAIATRSVARRRVRIESARSLLPNRDRGFWFDRVDAPRSGDRRIVRHWEFNPQRPERADMSIRKFLSPA
ncbi:MAG: hypothetical protein WD066_16895 [Planctomycetaceae bacterium]